MLQDGARDLGVLPRPRFRAEATDDLGARWSHSRTGAVPALASRSRPRRGSEGGALRAVDPRRSGTLPLPHADAERRPPQLLETQGHARLRVLLYEQGALRLARRGPRLRARRRKRFSVRRAASRERPGPPPGPVLLSLGKPGRAASDGLPFRPRAGPARARSRRTRLPPPPGMGQGQMVRRGSPRGLQRQAGRNPGRMLEFRHRISHGPLHHAAGKR